jgi:hypothetical protein
MTEEINRFNRANDLKWKIISDPSGDFPLGGLFRKMDIAKSARSKVWEPGTKFINIITGEVLTCQKTRLIPS